MGSIETMESITNAIAKIDSVYKQAGNSIAELLVQRVREGKANAKNIESDLNRLMSNVPEYMRSEIFKQALIAFTSAVANTGSVSTPKNGGNSQSHKNRNTDGRSGLFKSAW